MESDAFFPPYAVAEHGLRHRKTPTVGWVERSETHRPPAISRTMGFAALYPSYESWLANDPEVRRCLRGRILRAVVHVHVDGGCLRFANHFVGIDPVVIDLALGEWLHRHVVGEQPLLLCRAHVQRQGRPGTDVSGALERGVLTGRADEPRQVPALAFGPARSEERRVGKEWVRTGRSRWEPAP